MNTDEKEIESNPVVGIVVILGVVVYISLVILGIRLAVQWIFY